MSGRPANSQTRRRPILRPGSSAAAPPARRSTSSCSPASRLRQPQHDRGLRAWRHRSFQGRGYLEQRPDERRSGRPEPIAKVEPGVMSDAGSPALRPDGRAADLAVTLAPPPSSRRWPLASRRHGCGRPQASRVALPGPGGAAARCLRLSRRRRILACRQARAAPIVTAIIQRTLAVMRHQVTAADYRRCVEAEACPMVDRGATASDRPVVKVSWRDAQAYASWLSRETGVHFRLPTDEEWVYAAASRFKDDALPESLILGRSRPARTRVYDKDASREETIDKAPQPIGNFGVNENGLLDMAGNVWEWTDTCFVRSTLEGHGDVAATFANCGIRVVEGRHRAYMPDFIRDARAGGCSAGTPRAISVSAWCARPDPERRLEGTQPGRGAPETRGSPGLKRISRYRPLLLCQNKPPTATGGQGPRPPISRVRAGLGYRWPWALPSCCCRRLIFARGRDISEMRFSPGLPRVSGAPATRLGLPRGGVQGPAARTKRKPRWLGVPAEQPPARASRMKSGT